VKSLLLVNDNSILVQLKMRISFLHAKNVKSAKNSACHFFDRANARLKTDISAMGDAIFFAAQPTKKNPDAGFFSVKSYYAHRG